MAVVQGHAVRRRAGIPPNTLVMADPPANATHYHPDTPEPVRRVVDSHLAARQRGQGARLRFHYGDGQTGQAWGDVETGYVGRSTGQQRIPLVVHNARSMGGGALMTHAVVKIEGSRKYRDGSRPVLYQHPNYTPPQGD